MEENITRINNSGKSLKTQHNHLQDGTKFLDGRQIMMKNNNRGRSRFFLGGVAPIKNDVTEG